MFSVVFLMQPEGLLMPFARLGKVLHGREEKT